MPLKSRRQALRLHLAVLAVPVALLMALTWWQMRGSMKRNALFAAVRHNDTAEVIALLDAGADPNARDSSDPRISPLEQLGNALSHRNKTPYGQTPLLAALSHVDYSNPQNPEYGYSHPHPALVAALLDRGADPLLTDTVLNTSAPIFDAVAAGNTDVVETMLAHGVKVNQRGEANITPLGYAAAMGKTPVLRLLLEKGADVNAQNAEGWTPLMYAAMTAREPECVRVLLAHHADINIKDKKGLTALSHAKKPARWVTPAQRKNCPVITQMLKQAGAK